jgi:hypothetical protein
MRILLCTYVLNVLNEALDRLPAARIITPTVQNKKMHVNALISNEAGRRQQERYRARRIIAT